MRILVLGAGVVGTASAWFLRQAGHEVVVAERQAAAAMETSFANGGQISVSHAEPWANPQVFRKILKWFGKEDAPLLFRWRRDGALLRWGWQFLCNCPANRARENIRAIVNLALSSRSALQKLRAHFGPEFGASYDCLTRGILHFYTDEREFNAAAKAAGMMRDFGLDRLTVDADECTRIEPALADIRNFLVGGDYTASDESGDAHRFTQALAAKAAEAGVVFHYECPVAGLNLEQGAVRGAVCDDGKTLRADAVVLAFGSYSAPFLRPYGVKLPLYPAKGYSVTLKLPPEARAAPTVSLTDDERKLVLSRLGDRLRVAGTAEFNGFNLDLNPVRSAALMKRIRFLFPRLEITKTPEFWCGLRPATPSNVPLIGRVRPGLWLNTGHGTLGWTMACGSAVALTALIEGRRPEVDFPFLAGSGS